MTRLPRLGLSLALPLILAGASLESGVLAQTPAPAPPAATPAPATTPAPIPAVPVSPTPPPAAPALKPANELPVVDPAAIPAKKGPPKPVVPLVRARSNVAILQALDKVTAETIRFEAPVGQPVRYKTLVFTVRACETSTADEPTSDYSAYVLVDSQPVPSPGKGVPPARQVFRGWMYASSPGLNPLQHPVYDAWVIACKASAPVAPAPKR